MLRISVLCIQGYEWSYAYCNLDVLSHLCLHAQKEPPPRNLLEMLMSRSLVTALGTSVLRFLDVGGAKVNRSAHA